MLAIYFAYYNFCRLHKTLHDLTRAMAANLTKSIWSLKDLLIKTKDVLALFKREKEWLNQKELYGKSLLEQLSF